MIVKNEENIIERMLKSVIDIIDFFVICDTGSTDNTIKIIREFFSKYSHIRGILAQNNFVNFQDNRNQALSLCKGMGDYILLLDADHILSITNLDFLSSKADAYSIVQEDNNHSYQNIRLIKNTPDFYYIGYTHEVMQNKNQITIESIPKKIINIVDIGDGGNKEYKLERDIKLLKTSIGENPEIARNYFYLANCYFSLELFELAEKYYKKRIELRGWNQEIFYSFYKIGLANMADGNYQEAIISFLEAYQACPERCENLFYLREIYKSLDKDNLSKIFDELINRNKDLPSDNFLFKNKKIYSKVFQ
jgi:glycosyltransferase involved in cell wall biosynthesis